MGRPSSQALHGIGLRSRATIRTSQNQGNAIGAYRARSGYANCRRPHSGSIRSLLLGFFFLVLHRPCFNRTVKAKCDTTMFARLLQGYFLRLRARSPRFFLGDVERSLVLPVLRGMHNAERPSQTCASYRRLRRGVRRPRPSESVSTDVTCNSGMRDERSPPGKAIKISDFRRTVIWGSTTSYSRPLVKTKRNETNGARSRSSRMLSRTMPTL